MSQQLQFELVSPEKLLISRAVAMVTVPGGEGDFGVLPNHAPIIATVRPGVIEVYGDNDTIVSERIFVAGGFAEVTADRCTILAEEALPIAGLDRTKLESEARDLAEDLNLAQTDHEQAAIKERLDVVNAKIQAAG